MERLSDRPARVEGVATRAPAQYRLSRHAGDHLVDLAGRSDGRCIVTWLIKLGDWIRDLTAAGSRRAISELLEFQSKSAWVLRDGVVDAIAGQRTSRKATSLWSIPAR